MILPAPVTNWELHGVTLAGYCYAMRQGTKVQIVTAYRVSHNVKTLRYAVTLQVCTHLNVRPHTHTIVLRLSVYVWGHITNHILEMHFLVFCCSVLHARGLFLCIWILRCPSRKNHLMISLEICTNTHTERQYIHKRTVVIFAMFSLQCKLSSKLAEPPVSFFNFNWLWWCIFGVTGNMKLQHDN
jgi:hypothetical protein